MINASTLAFLNSGSVPMCGVVTAVAVARHQGYFIADPSDAELERSRGIGCFAFLFSDEIGSMSGRCGCILASWKSSAGGYDETEVFEARELARRKAEEICKSIRAAISRKLGFNSEDEEKILI
jgi:exosome complex component RRP46